MNLSSQDSVLKKTEPFEIEAAAAAALLPKVAQGKRCFWQGKREGRVQYSLEDVQGLQTAVDVAALLPEDEKIIFRAFQDWYAAAIRKTGEGLHGYFTFEVLQFEVEDAPRSWSELAALLTAHGKKLQISERRLIQFGSLWGILRKHTEADFGRVESKLEVDFFKPSAQALARKVKKNSGGGIDGAVQTLILRDLSREAGPFLEEGLAELKSVARDVQGCFYWHPRSNRHLHI